MINWDVVHTKTQRGAMLVISSFLILAILLVGALVIEYLRYQHVALALQRSADVAALAGARVLRNPSTKQDPVTKEIIGQIRDGVGTRASEAWSMSKSAVFAGLKLNPLSGVPIDVSKFDPKNSALAPAKSGATECTHTVLEEAGATPEFECANFVFMENEIKVTVSIQRELVFLRNDTKETFFLKLEPVDGPPSGLLSCDDAYKDDDYYKEGLLPVNAYGPSCCTNAGIAVTQVANSVRVAMRLEGMRTFLGTLLGVTRLPPIMREAIASPEPIDYKKCDLAP